MHKCTNASQQMAAADLIEQLRQDALRYRWLRQHKKMGLAVTVLDDYRASGIEIDAAIDLAMSTDPDSSTLRG